MLLCHFLALKKSYVDVFNPSGAPAKPSEAIMAPATVPMPSIPQSGGYFVPGAVPAVADSQTQQQLDVSILVPCRGYLLGLVTKKQTPRNSS